MALQTSGAISLANIQTEMGGSNPIGMNEYYRGGAYVVNQSSNNSIPTSGTISMSNFYGGSNEYVIPYSCRFETSTDTLLSRTHGSPTSQKVWTWSGWLKRDNLGNGSDVNTISGIVASGNYGQDYEDLVFPYAGSEANRLQYFNAGPGTAQGQKVTNFTFNSTTTWWHIVVRRNNSDVDIFINGSEVTSWLVNNGVNNTYAAFNRSGRIHRVGSSERNRFQYTGNMAEINFIDGQALGASSFGETRSGAWKPNLYTGTYGNNGYRLNFSNANSLGADSSGRGNNFTATNLSADHRETDVPF
tara:strand:- start:136 stop:1041 length:906 start_codon:yes stop_codon:yes gene_type:complete